MGQYIVRKHQMLNWGGHNAVILHHLPRRLKLCGSQNREYNVNDERRTSYAARRGQVTKDGSSPILISRP
jgi:hypothetical protein